MCGILGVLPAVDNEIFKRNLDLLTHRGPDSSGTWTDGKISMGHRRLSILDISSHGSQPMHIAERYHIIFNGEVYNFVELRDELIAKGYAFTSDTDTEVVLNAYIEWGEDCVKKFNGMWSLAIWDSVEERLFLSRDRMGKKPLYYIHDGDNFFFSSEQKSLLSFLSVVTPSHNFQSLIQKSYSYESTSQCLFKGIKRFPAASSGYFNRGNLKISKYWSILDADKIDVPSKYSDQVDYLRDLLLDATKIRMRSDVPLGTGLSGGVDSSAVSATVSQVKNYRNDIRIPENYQNSFCASFPGTVMDENYLAEEVASYLKVKHHQVVIDPSIMIDELEKACFLVEDIHEVNPLPHIMLYRSMRDKGVLVTLDGHGGDELFCGYESSVLNALPDAFPNLKNMNHIMDVYKNLHPKNEYFKGLNKKQIMLYLAKSEARMVKKFGVADSIKIRNKLGSLGTHLYELSFYSVLPTLLRNYDRYSMASGVEIRMPLLDYRIVEFAFALNWDSKLYGGFTKSVLRDAVGDWLPEKIIRRKEKIGFAPPIQDWMKGPMKEYFLDVINSEQFINSSLINGKHVKTKIEGLVSGNLNMTLYDAEQVWKKFYIYLWEKVFIKNKKWAM